jgi:hypothetical protein
MKRFAIPALLAAASFAVYLPTLRFDFVMDDARQIEMMESRFTWSQIPSYFTTDVWSYVNRERANYYRPVFLLWLMLNYQALGLDHAAWHASAVLAHALATLLLYFLARRLTGDETTAAIAALIFGVHPVHLEGVAWVSGATEPLWAMLFFAALLLFVAARQETARLGRARWLRIGSATMFALAVLAKETAAVTPLLIFGYTWLFPESPADTGARRARSALSAAIVYLQIVVVYLGMRLFALGGFAPKVGLWSPKKMIATLPAAAWLYVRELVWPFHLTIFPRVTEAWRPGLGKFAAPVLGSAITLAALVWIWRRSRLAAFCVLLLAVPLLPAFDLRAFPPYDFVHDRYLYVPSAGLCILLALALRKLPSVSQVAATAALVAVLALLTVRESQPWRNAMTLAEHAVSLAPESLPAQSLMASALIQQDRYAEATPWVERVLKVTPGSATMHMTLGLCHLKQSHWSQAAAEFRLVINGLPDNAQSHLCLGMAELEMGQIEDAESHMREAVRLRPHASVQYRGYRFYLADLLERKGDFPSALAQYNAELEEYPDEEWVLDRASALKRKMAGN